VFWLPQLIVKHPGVLMWDTYLQIRQYLEIGARIANHPPLGTLLYGWMYRFGQWMGNKIRLAFVAGCRKCPLEKSEPRRRSKCYRGINLHHL